MSETQIANDIATLESIIDGTHSLIRHIEPETSTYRNFPGVCDKEALCAVIGEIVVRSIEIPDPALKKLIRKAIVAWDELIDSKRNDRGVREKKRLELGTIALDVVLLDDNFPLLHVAAKSTSKVTVRDMHALMGHWITKREAVATKVFDLPVLPETVEQPTLVYQPPALSIDPKTGEKCWTEELDNGFLLSYSPQEQFVLRSPDSKTVARFGRDDFQVLEIKGQSFLSVKNKNDKWGVTDLEGNFLISPMFDRFLVFADGVCGLIFDMDLWCYFAFENLMPVRKKVKGCPVTNNVFEQVQKEVKINDIFYGSSTFFDGQKK